MLSSWWTVVAIAAATAACRTFSPHTDEETLRRFRNKARAQELRFGWSVPQARYKRSSDPPSKSNPVEGADPIQQEPPVVHVISSDSEDDEILSVSDADPEVHEISSDSDASIPVYDISSDSSQDSPQEGLPGGSPARPFGESPAGSSRGSPEARPPGRYGVSDTRQVSVPWANPDTWYSDEEPEEYPNSDTEYESDEQSVGTPTNMTSSDDDEPPPPPMRIRPPIWFCHICKPQIGKPVQTIFRDFEKIKQHCVKFHRADPRHINRPAGNFPFRCLDCPGMFTGPRTYLYHHHRWHLPDPDPPRPPHMHTDRFQCPHCSLREGADLTFQQLKDHVMLVHRTRNLVEFPTERIQQNNVRRVFRGMRMHYLPVIDSARIADGMANRDRANRLLLNPNVERHVQCPPGERSMMMAWPSINPDNFQQMGTCIPSAQPTPQQQQEQPPTSQDSRPHHEESSQSPAEPRGRQKVKGNSNPNAGKGKGRNSEYDPKKKSRDDADHDPIPGEAPGGSSRTDDAAQAAPSPMDVGPEGHQTEDFRLTESPMLSNSQISRQALRPEFCFIEGDSSSPDFQNIVCIEDGPISSIPPEEADRFDNDQPMETEDEEEMVPPPTTTPVIESSTQWFSTTPPPPGSGPAGLPGGLPPLGGLLCAWSIATKSREFYRSRRSMRIPPSPWWERYDTKAEIHSFWQAFAKKVDMALSSSSSSQALPDLAWNCQVIHSKKDHSFKPGPIHTLPFGLIGDHQQPLQRGIETFLKIRDKHRIAESSQHQSPQHDELRRRRWLHGGRGQHRQ